MIVFLQDYIQSFASTNEVHTNGNVTQNHSGLKIRNATVPTRDTPKYNQYFFKSLFVDAIYFLIFNLRRI